MNRGPNVVVSLLLSVELYTASCTMFSDPSVTNYIRKRWIQGKKNWEKFKTSVRQATGNRSEYGILLLLLLLLSIECNGHTAYRRPVTSLLFTRFNVFVFITLSMAAYKIYSTASGRMIELCFRRSNNLNLRQTKRYRCGYPIIKR